MENNFTSVQKPLRVVHFPQVGSCKKSFIVEVANEEQARMIMNVLSIQHIWLEKNKIIPDFSNSMFVEMFDEDSDGEGNAGWIDYHNEEEGMDWDELEEEFFSNKDDNFSLESLRIKNSLR